MPVSGVSGCKVSDTQLSCKQGPRGGKRECLGKFRATGLLVELYTMIYVYNVYNDTNSSDLSLYLSWVEEACRGQSGANVAILPS